MKARLALAAALWLAAVLGAAEALGEETDFYVAANGRDNWSGRLAAPTADGADGPFATLPRARDAVRALRPKRPVRVVIRGGTYFLGATFRLGPEDSGSQAAPVVYEAYPGETPVLSGGTRIAGPWRKTDDTEVFAVQLAKEPPVRDLFVNGSRQPCARMPNQGHWKLRPVGKSKTVFEYEPGQLAGWEDAASGLVVVRPYEWVDFHLPIGSIDAQARRVTLAASCGYALSPGGYGAPGIYHVENVRAALDRPGEWCHNRDSGMLYYRPPAGVDLASAEAVVGMLHVMVAMDGNARAGKWVEHVSLRGLTFQHSGREGQWQHFEGTAVRMASGVRHCRIERCRFADLGASGVVIWKECVANEVTGCEFTGVGDTAVRVFDYLGEGPPVSADNRIVNNYIHHGGAVRQSICGIEISGSEGNLVANNHIHDMPYIGIRVSGARGDHWSARAVPSLAPPYTAAKIKPHVRTRKNVVEHNYIHHVMQELRDGGGIYFWGTMGVGANVIRANLLHDIGLGKRAAIGIYLDDSCDDVLVRDNVVWGADIGLHLHGSPRNTIENNVFAHCANVDISIQPEAYNLAPMDTIVRRNIFAFGAGEVFGTGEGWNKCWDRRPVGEMDHNLYWRGGKPVALGAGNLKGKDAHSVVAAPAFAPPDPGRYVLPPGPAAGELGIQPIDLTRTGLLAPPPWCKDVPQRQTLRMPR